MPKLLLSPLARRDLRKLWTFSRENWGVRTAESYMRGISDLLARLAEGELKGVACDDIRDGYHRVVFRSHVLFYKATNDGITVVRILHQAMDVTRHL